jgi:hypothetical protein
MHRRSAFLAAALATMSSAAPPQHIVGARDARALDYSVEHQLGMT